MIMEDKVTIIQDSKSTTITLTSDVAYIEASFEDSLVSRVIIKKK